MGFLGANLCRILSVLIFWRLQLILHFHRILLKLAFMIQPRECNLYTFSHLYPEKLSWHTPFNILGKLPTLQSYNEWKHLNLEQLITLSWQLHYEINLNLHCIKRAVLKSIYWYGLLRVQSVYFISPLPWKHPRDIRF